MTDSKLIDSSAWLSYFYAENPKIKSIVESDEILLTSALAIYEVKLKLLKDKKEPSLIQKSLDIIKKRSLILSIDEKISGDASEISFKHTLHMADALIYVSAVRNNALLITLDNDFRGLSNVFILD